MPQSDRIWYYFLLQMDSHRQMDKVLFPSPKPHLGWCWLSICYWADSSEGRGRNWNNWLHGGIWGLPSFHSTRLTRRMTFLCKRCKEDVQDRGDHAEQQAGTEMMQDKGKEARKVTRSSTVKDHKSCTYTFLHRKCLCAFMARSWYNYSFFYKRSRNQIMSKPPTTQRRWRRCSGSPDGQASP